MDTLYSDRIEKRRSFRDSSHTLFKFLDCYFDLESKTLHITESTVPTFLTNEKISPVNMSLVLGGNQGMELTETELGSFVEYW